VSSTKAIRYLLDSGLGVVGGVTAMQAHRVSTGFLAIGTSRL